MDVQLQLLVHAQVETHLVGQGNPISSRELPRTREVYDPQSLSFVAVHAKVPGHARFIVEVVTSFLEHAADFGAQRVRFPSLVSVDERAHEVVKLARDGTRRTLAGG